MSDMQGHREIELVDDQRPAFALADLLADLARIHSEALVLGPEPDGPLFAEFELRLVGHRFHITVEDCG